MSQKTVNPFTFIAALTCLTLTACSATKQAAIGMTGAQQTQQINDVHITESHTSAKTADAILTAVSSQYQPWKEVNIEGKMSMDGLPLDPTAKIYMKHGEELLISLRAPIVGEVARIEIADGEILAVNRLKKVYMREDLQRFLNHINFSLTDVQDIFLGRIFVLGKGTLDLHNSKDMTVNMISTDNYAITPQKQPVNANYGFSTTSDYKLCTLTAKSADGRYHADADYVWGKDNESKDIELAIKADNHIYKAIFRFKAPDYNPKAMQRIEINKKWKQLSIREFFKSI